MTAIESSNPQPPVLSKKPRWMSVKHAHHFRSHTDEFDACKIGMWLFLTTEVLLFSGLFVAYAMFRMKYPEAFANGSHYLDWRWGALNTAVLLLSSFTVAWSIRNAQLNQQGLLKFNLAFTILCAIAFIAIKFNFEYIPKWADGKRPGVLFAYPFAENNAEVLWWSIYYTATGIHAAHVVIGAALIGWVFIKATRGHYGPKHYTGVEVVGLYWHLVDLIWIFLFPLLYLIH
ncbi:MAG: cytochrome c oxidase subunit 3 family protein [Phycisphaerales bacterium JB037]